MELSSFERLLAHDERLRALNDIVPAGIMVLRVEDGKVLFANRFFKQVLGVEGGALVGDSWAEYFVDPADRERLMVRFAEADEVRDFEVRLRRAGGRQVWGLVSMASVPVEEQDLLLFAFVDISALKEAEAEIRDLANHDALTGVPSLRLLKERVGQAMARAERDNTQFAVLFVDLDGFKGVNDRLGHDAGDAVLQRAAGKMLACVRKTDTVARLGGDEFVALFESADEASARQVGERIVEQVGQPLELEQGIARVGASVGIAVYPRHGRTFEALLKAADRAMYLVKGTTKNAVAIAD